MAKPDYLWVSRIGETAKLRDALTAMIENEKRSEDVWLKVKILSTGIPAGVIWC